MGATPSGEAIERLEKANLRLGQKIDILLVELGEKPATLNTFHSISWKEGEEEQSIPEVQFKEYMSAIDSAGLLIKVSPDKVVCPDEEAFRGPEGASLWEWANRNGPIELDLKRRQRRRIVYIAKTPENLELMEEGDRLNNNDLLAKAYGFPESATEAYTKNLTKSGSELLPDANPAALAFAQYAFSPEHAEQELEVGRRWAEAVQAASPKLYEEKLVQFAKRSEA